MMTTLHPLARAWLDRVESLATGLAPVDREELLADLRDHIAQEFGPEADDAQVQDGLARLGDPADIVAAAEFEESPSDLGPIGLSGAETITLVGFALSGLLLVIWPIALVAWVMAAVLLATKDRWEGVENLVALLLPLGFAMPWVLFTLWLVNGGSEASPGSIIATLAIMATLAATIAAVVWLVRRVRRRTRSV